MSPDTRCGDCDPALTIDPAIKERDEGWTEEEIIKERAKERDAYNQARASADAPYAKPVPGIAPAEIREVEDLIRDSLEYARDRLNSLVERAPGSVPAAKYRAIRDLADALVVAWGTLRTTPPGV
jgi:hypothetical protein